MGDPVNVEYDILARYLVNFENRPSPAGADLDILAEMGVINGKLKQIVKSRMKRSTPWRRQSR